MDMMGEESRSVCDTHVIHLTRIPILDGDIPIQMVQLKGNPQTNLAYLIKLELLVAKNLIAANLNGTSDPYAIITCGTEKQFSSMVPG
nr:bag-associated gram protein 1 [Quercus suber]